MNLNEEIFLKCATHLLSQGKRSMGWIPDQISDSKRCMYRGEGGLQCALGCLISDKMYDPDIEGKAGSSLGVVSVIAESMGTGYSVVKSGSGDSFEITDVNMEILHLLQSIHDISYTKDWRQCLEAAIETFDLNVELPQ